MLNSSTQGVGQRERRGRVAMGTLAYCPVRGQTGLLDKSKRQHIKEDPEAVKTAKARAKARAEGREAAGGSRRRREPKGEKE